jgi:hypothetical protein
VDDCSNSGSYIDEGRCVGSCPSQRPYGNHSMGGLYGTCVADCRLLNPARINFPFYPYQCVDDCGDSHYYIDEGTCVYGCPSQRPYVNFNSRSATYGTCVTDCRLLNPARINSQIGGPQCVDDCSNSHYDIDEGTCVDSCPSQRPYINRSMGEYEYGTCVADCRLLNPARMNAPMAYPYPECVDDCDSHYYIDEGTCVDSCPSQRPYDNSSMGVTYGTCVADCRLLNPARINSQIGGPQCVDDCSNSHYDIDEGTCVDSCPSQRPYVNGSMGGRYSNSSSWMGSSWGFYYGTCVTDCGLLNPARINAWIKGSLQCVDYCGYDVNDEGTCVTSCPSQRPYVDGSNGRLNGTCVADCRLLNPARINSQIGGSLQCVDNCSDSRYALDEGLCVDVCPSQRPYFNLYVDIHGSALYPVRCVANCSALSPPRVVWDSEWDDVEYPQCLDVCGEGYWEYAGNCSQTCPSTHLWVSTGPYSDDIPRQCVASCSELVPPRVRSSDAGNIFA